MFKKQQVVKFITIMDANNDHRVAAAEVGAPADGNSGNGAELVAGDNNASAGGAVNVDVDVDPVAAAEEEQDADTSNEMFLKQAISILQHQHDFPVRTRNKILELARAFVDDGEEEQTANDRRLIQKAISLLQERLEIPFRTRTKIVELAQQFVDGIGEDIKDMITDIRTEEHGYNGLDSDRETEKEVTTALGYFPQLLSQRHGRWNLYPIQYLIYMVDNTKYIRNVKAVSFVHLFVRLAIKFNSFEENLRGGLLIERERGNINILQSLVRSSDASCDEHHQQRVDTIFLAVLIRLRQSGYFKKEDIQQYQLVHRLCQQKVHMAQKRFRFLVEIDPSSLLQTDQDGFLPFHWTVRSVEKFRSVCDAVFGFYPKWRGLQLLHQKTPIYGRTPFWLAKKYIGRTTATQIVEETFARYSDIILPDIPQALILAATDERIHLDCVYFLLKRQPDIVLGLLPRYRQESRRSSSSSDKNATNRTSNSNNNDDNDNTSRILRRSTRKRKRN